MVGNGLHSLFICTQNFWAFTAKSFVFPRTSHAIHFFHFVICSRRWAIQWSYHNCFCHAQTAFCFHFTHAALIRHKFFLKIWSFPKVFVYAKIPNLWLEKDSSKFASRWHSYILRTFLIDGRIGAEGRIFSNLWSSAHGKYKNSKIPIIACKQLIICRNF